MPGNNAHHQVERHRAAIMRSGLSRPIRLALETGVLTADSSFFDYGCGRGVDVRMLADKGHDSRGWDPFYFPESERAPADVVNLGYVINVIEDEAERRVALASAWGLARRVLIVAAQVQMGEPGKGHVAFNDGLITSRNTFQKYYAQDELKEYIDTVLGVEAVPAGLGTYFVFRDEQQAQTFRASRFHSKAITPKVKAHVKNFNEYRELLEPLMQFVSARGRLPALGELSAERVILDEFRSFNKAFEVIKRATDSGEWGRLIERRRQDMLAYIALSRFGKRPKYSDLPAAIQHDIKAFFGNYTRACEIGDRLLFSLGQPDVIPTACKISPVGKFVGNSLYVHVSALDSLDLVLRLYEGCASRTFGKLEQATIIKFRADKPAVSYLFYPDFDTDPHPALRSSMRADLRGLFAGYRDYTDVKNPPILHRKETFVTPDFPLYNKFARLTAQEEKWGLLDDPATIGNRVGWEERLMSKGVTLRGHRVIRLANQ